MKTYLLRFSVSGVKNIEKKISIDFYNSTLRRDSLIHTKEKNTKAIYGINGSGKTAYIVGAKIYQNLNLRSDYLLQDKVKERLFGLINRKTKSISLEAIFAFCEEDDRAISEIIKHEITISLKNEEDVFPVFKLGETLSKSVSNNINGNYKTIYAVNDGMVNVFKPIVGGQHFFKNNYDIGNSAFSPYVLERLDGSALTSPKESRCLEWYISAVNLFANSLYVCLESEEDETTYFRFFLSKGKESFVIKNNEDIVPIKEIDGYHKELERLTSFIRILKPELKEIAFKCQSDGKYYHCFKRFVYDDYSVDERYESTGIRKITKLYYYLKAAYQGGIVFIDEMDANLSGVFLDRWIDFMELDGEGQLCFTTHNIFSMNNLRKYKGSMTTIGESGKVVNIVKNGHYNPMNLFYEGMIEDSPFNINYFDFYKAFAKSEGED